MKRVLVSFMVVSMVLPPVFVVFAQNSETSAPAVCDPSLELAHNGGFENVVVDDPRKWEIFPWNTPNLGWETNRPIEDYGLEVQAGYTEDALPWAAYNGFQYAEIDGGDGGDNFKVINRLDTAPGYKYRISFAYSPRPHQTLTDNTLNIMVNDAVIDSVVADGATMTNTFWTPKSHEYVANSSVTLLAFVDQGINNSPSGYGMFIDDVSVRCISVGEPPPPPPPPPPPANTPPAITLLGDNPMHITVNTTFVDPGATSTDIEDGDLTSQIVIMGAVNTAIVGNYTLTYSVSDSEGASVSVSRVVIVDEASLPPPNGGGNGGGGGGGNNGGGGGGGMGGHRRDVSNLFSSGGGGEVLGASSCLYLRHFLRRDWNNDRIEMLKLQSFLNAFEGEKLPLTAVFDEPTLAAVGRFQNKYFGDILEPWGHTEPTGFVYILTRKKVNEIFCQTAFPITDLQQREIDAFRTFVQFLRDQGIQVNGGVHDIPETVGGSQIENDNILSGISIVGDENEDVAILPVVELQSTTSLEDSGERTSILRNVAVSLFALSWSTFLLAGLAILAVLFLLLSRFQKDKIVSENVLNDSNNISPSANYKVPDNLLGINKPVSTSESSVIILPDKKPVEGEKSEIPILPGEEIVIDEEDQEN